MLTIEQNRAKASQTTETTPAVESVDLTFPSGLLGFEGNKQFKLLSDVDLAPYKWLKGMDADQSFLVIPPPFATATYSVVLSDEDVACLGLNNPGDAVVLNIATYHPDETVTVNLKGPIVFHKETRVARQVVPLNASQHSLAHPMGN